MNILTIKRKIKINNKIENIHKKNIIRKINIFVRFIGIKYKIFTKL
jgi:hypothetical protein